MVRDGTSLVEVEAISFDNPGGDRPTRQTRSAPPRTEAPATAAANEVFVQVGAFGSRANADRRLALLRSGGIGTGFVSRDTAATPVLYRVRIGPISGVDQYDLLVTELEKLGIDDPYLVTD